MVKELGIQFPRFEAEEIGLSVYGAGLEDLLGPPRVP